MDAARDLNNERGNLLLNLFYIVVFDSLECQSTICAEANYLAIEKNPIWSDIVIC
jgi:hypothetical protein